MRSLLYLIIVTTVVIKATNASVENPNLVIIMTDEHNLRTIGCYRSLLSKPNVWGKGVKVNTPNIDSLARDGAIFKNFNSVAPLCTPSRASFMSGLYPEFTGASENHGAMNENVITFAEVLQKRRGYHTSYIGKWHLNGEEKPGFSNDNENRTFGFNERKYQFNRGHWKLFDEDKQSGEIIAYDWKDRNKIGGKIEDAYATDFLFTMGINFIKRQIEGENHFVLMLSIPDPHGPNHIRTPYDTMYNDMNFKLPASAVAAYNKRPALPGWSPLHTNLETANHTINDIENDDKWQANMRNYFGMVKLIDDKVGELLSFIKESGQDENTIVVFTSDHGDMMGEHANYNKGKPYLTSAGVPFIIRYPGQIKNGKVIKTAYSSPDFAPTILSLMGVNHSDISFQGIDGSEEILSDSKWSKRAQVRFITHVKHSNWVAAVDRQYKLILSRNGSPWLFDMKKDPNELINYATDPSYSNIRENLQQELYYAMEPYKLSLADESTIYFDGPVCLDTNDQIPSLPYFVCNDLEQDEYKDKCNLEDVSNFCPESCNICCEDSSGFVKVDGELKSCDDFKFGQQWQCENSKISKFCPVTCSKCTAEATGDPSVSSFLSNTPTIENTQAPSNELSPDQTNTPIAKPLNNPRAGPSIVPTIITTTSPYNFSSNSPTTYPPNPSDKPSLHQKNVPSVRPTIVPSTISTSAPSINRSTSPTAEPSIHSRDSQTGSTDNLSNNPTTYPPNPSDKPSLQLTNIPSARPSIVPSTNSTSTPSINRDASPTVEPSIYSRDSQTGSTYNLSNNPTTYSPNPSDKPSLQLTNVPSARPSIVPSTNSTSTPSINRNASPTVEPSIYSRDSQTGSPHKLSYIPSTVLITINTLPSMHPTSDPITPISMSPALSSTILSYQPSLTVRLTPTTKPSSNDTFTSASPLNSIQQTTIPTAAPFIFLALHPTDIPSRDSPTAVLPSIRTVIPSAYTITTLPSGTPITSPADTPGGTEIQVASLTSSPLSIPYTIIMCFVGVLVLTVIALIVLARINRFQSIGYTKHNIKYSEC